MIAGLASLAAMVAICIYLVGVALLLGFGREQSREDPAGIAGRLSWVVVSFTWPIWLAGWSLWAVGSSAWKRSK